jgi:hypothetical protein
MANGGAIHCAAIKRQLSTTCEKGKSSNFRIAVSDGLSAVD